ncbi:hypothetical protein [Streptomyces sp. NBC_01304]|uniref:hypothetical protein n=1 Tax=Streptomyces sp. NBC_01304 TaxID=2903818 RepID=UPI002E153358|nr:hypothetical protein OG430_04285 [Streptomyces sp. NBC_01304]
MTRIPHARARMTAVPRARHLRHAARTGSALAATLAPLVVGALLARACATDPLTSVNALMTSTGERARLSRAEARACLKSAGRHGRSGRGEGGLAGRFTGRRAGRFTGRRAGRKPPLL